MSDLDTFRSETRSWLEANCPASMRTPQKRSEAVYGGRNASFPSDDAKLWMERMVEKGWTAPEWAPEYGGAGLSRAESKVLGQEMESFGCRKPLTGHGFWMLGPALLEYGTEEQKLQHLPKIARGEIRWCQGYSEPGAGSDLASLRCKAEDKGDHFLVNGQKCWTSGGEESDWIFCLVRTSSEGKKQEGISFLLFDMATEGVSTHPVPLITGDSHFCDTFFDNVAVPKENLVGELNKGWSVAKALLVHERSMMSELERNMPKPKYDLLGYAQNYLQKRSDGRLADGAMRARIAENLMEKQAVDLSQQRAFEEGAAGVFDMRVASIFKYVGTENQQLREELIVDILGHTALLWGSEKASDDEQEKTYGWMSGKAITIAGGSSEVQLNLVAKKSLGLPER